MHMTPGLMNLAILRGEFTALSLIPLADPPCLTTNMLSKLNPLILKSSGPILAGSTNKHTIEKTFNKTTEWTVASTSYPMRKHFKSRVPAFNIPTRSEGLLLIPSSQIPLPLTLVSPWCRFLLVKEL